MEKKLLNRLKDFVKTDTSQSPKGETDSELQELADAAQSPETLKIFHQLIDGQNHLIEETSRTNAKLENLLRENSALLEQMIAELKKLTSISERFIQAMEALPKSSREQSERLSAIEDQLQFEGQTDRALLTNLDTLGKNVASLARFAETQQSAQGEFVKNIQQQFEPVIEIIKKQNRFAAMILTSSVIVIILLVILVLLAAK